MTELGQTHEPRALVPGTPAAVQASADKLRAYGEVLVEAGEGLRRIDAGGWTGKAADAFRDFFDGKPEEWIRSGDAFETAAQAVEVYREVLEWAQRQAGEAIHVWDEAQALTDQATQAHQQAERNAPEGAATPPFVDPGAEKRAHARWLLTSAREQLHIEGTHAQERVAEAKAGLVGGRSFFGQAWQELSAAGEGAADEFMAFGETAWKLDPARLWAEPGEVWEDVQSVPATVQQAWANMSGSDLIDLQHLRDNPGRAIGESALRFGKLAGPQGLVLAPFQLAHQIRKAAEEKPRHHVIISEDRYPESAGHAEDAQNGDTYRGFNTEPGLAKEHPREVTIDREGASARRHEAVKVVPALPRAEGLDRDEYPPAVFAEGGRDASVQYINASDNRGSGSSMRHQMTGLGNGTEVTITVR